MSASVASLTTTNLDGKSRGKVTRLSFPITKGKVESRIPRNTARIQNEEEDGRGGERGKVEMWYKQRLERQRVTENREAKIETKE